MVSEVLTRREKLALKFADKLGSDPQALDERFFDLLRVEIQRARDCGTGTRYRNGRGL